MTVTVLPIGFTPIASPEHVIPTDGIDVSGASDFGNTFTNALDSLDQAQKAADESSKLAATGDVASIEAHMAHLTEVQLMTQLTVAVRNRAVEAFNEIMRMQL